MASKLRYAVKVTKTLHLQRTKKKITRKSDDGLIDSDWMTEYESDQSSSQTRLPELSQKKDVRMAALANGLPTRIDLRESSAKTNCEVSSGFALVPIRNGNSNAMTEVLPPLGGRNTQLGIEISNAMTEVLPPLGGRNAQSGKENVESSVGKATGQPNALSSGMPGVLDNVAWAIAKRVFDPGGLATSTQTSHELAVIEGLNHSNLAMPFLSLCNDKKAIL